MSTSPAHSFAPAHARARPGPVSRRFGYLVGAAINALLLHLVNTNPGWEAVPFLTDATTEVLGLVNASITLTLVANVVYLVRDPAWLRALGDVVTTSVSVLAMVRIWQVWPVAFPAGTVWDEVARVVVAVSLVGGLVAIVVSAGRFVRALATPAGRAA